MVAQSPEPGAHDENTRLFTIQLIMCWYVVKREDMSYALPLSGKLWIVLTISLNATESNDSSFSSLKALWFIFDLLVYDEKQLL